MSYDMAFQGVFLYPDSKTAQQALAQLRSYEELDESVVGEDEVIAERDRIRVECFTSAPAMVWESSCGAIEVLSELAIGGHVNAQYDPGEGEAAMFRLRFLPSGDHEELDEPFPDGIAPIGEPAAYDEEDDLDGELSMAARIGDELKVRKLLGRGVDPEAGLYGAVHEPHILELLLAHGLRPAGDPARAYSPLCVAARAGNAACVRLLVAAGASTDETDTPSRATPLMLAAEGMHEEAVATLLELGADPNARDARGNTALMYTVWLGNEEVVSIAVALRAAGASTDAHNDAGETMWDRAKLQVPPALYRALEEKLGRSDRTGG